MSAVWPNGLKTRPDFSTLWRGYPGHNGLDCKNFDVNHAVMGGVVITAGWQVTGGGYVVGVLADNGDYHRYLHCVKGLHVVKGQRVVVRQPLGDQGTSGWSTGKHLHFAVRKGGRWGKYIDPLPYLEALVGSAPAGGDTTPFPAQQVTEEEDDMKFIKHPTQNVWFLFWGDYSHRQTADLEEARAIKAFLGYGSNTDVTAEYITAEKARRDAIRAGLGEPVAPTIDYAKLAAHIKVPTAAENGVAARAAIVKS